MPDRSRATLIADRRDAIRAALATIGKDDCLLIAGQGHEDYQIIGKTKRHFSDQEEILAWAEEARKAGAGRTRESGHGT